MRVHAPRRMRYLPHTPEEIDEMLKAAGFHDEFPDVYGPVPACYVRNDDVESGTVRQRGQPATA